jgi:hypothetical protein
MPYPGWRGKTRSIPSSDLQDRSLGVGDPTSASKASGKGNARWASVNLTGGGATPGTIKEYDVPHDLGAVPTSVTLDHLENAAVAGTFIEANAVRRENWSHSHAHVSLRLVSGSFDGCVARFLVKGR